MIIKDKIEYLNKYLETLIEKGVFPGASYALLTKDDVYIHYLGRAQIEPIVKNVDIDTIYDLASLTKVIATTTAIMILIEKGELTLNTKVKDILPNYKYDFVFIKHLLTHTSGHRSDLDYFGYENKDDLVNLIYDEKIDYSKIDKEVIYSDIGFLLLGLIIEKISGSLAEFVEENILKPLEMNDTFFNPPKEKIKRCAATEYCKIRKKIIIGQVHDEKAFIMGGIAGHAGLFSTAKDLSNFAKMILNDGIYNEKIILSRNSIELMSKCFTANLNANRGLGWALKDCKSSCGDLVSDKTLYHTGFTGTSILIDRYFHKAFILLTNRVHPTRDNIKLIYEREKINNIAVSAIL